MKLKDYLILTHKPSPQFSTASATVVSDEHL